MGGFTTLARETGLPLRCLEIGASAGLNQIWDRFRFETEQWSWGDPRSPVKLSCEWKGNVPPLLSVSVAEHRACDQAPIDIRSREEALRLQSYVWPDQTLRLERLTAAIAMARAVGAQVEKADAADWVEANVTPREGVATVLFHSVVWQYLNSETAERISAHLRAAGGKATPSAPLAWLSMDHFAPGSQTDEREVRLTLWPGGEERVLARAHPHGATVAWLGA